MHDDNKNDDNLVIIIARAFLQNRWAKYHLFKETLVIKSKHCDTLFNIYCTQYVHIKCINDIKIQTNNYVYLQYDHKDKRETTDYWKKEQK